MIRIEGGSKGVSDMKNKNIKKAVRKGYAAIATQDTSCCGPVSSCCGNSDPAVDISKKIGYTEEDLKSVPDGSNLGLGCGNPIALASLKEGETVLDLGSGAGFDCFLAARKVGRTGKVIGVDMTPEMIDKARDNAKRGNYGNVEFRLGEIEKIPAADSSVDTVISNCVINLSPHKRRVFQEAFRILKPGGRLMVSDLVLTSPLPDSVKNSIEAYVGCLAGASLKKDYLKTIREAGFHDVAVIEEASFPPELMANDPTAQAIAKDRDIPRKDFRKAVKSVVSIRVKGIKP